MKSKSLTLVIMTLIAVVLIIKGYKAEQSRQALQAEIIELKQKCEGE